MQALSQTHFKFPNQTAHFAGKVRDVYHISDKYVVMIATDRISAFDVVLPRAIPFKGQVLNQTAAYFLEATKDIVPNWLLDVPHPNVSIGKAATPFKVEMVIRGYLAGHAARQYAEGVRILCGEALPLGLKENDILPAPIITPTTKAEEGHDKDISKDDIIDGGLINALDYAQLERYTHALFKRGTSMAAERGLLLVDTKYEFGKAADGRIILIDEVHTPDSSRYFYADGYEQRQRSGQGQTQLSKEFVRKWLIEQGFMGKEGQKVPPMTDEYVQSVSDRYIELYEQVTGRHFIKGDYAGIETQIEVAVGEALLNMNRG